jgi:hypothetical protein
MKSIHNVAATVIGLAMIAAAPVLAQQPSAEVGTLAAKGPGMAAGAQVSTVSAKVVALDKDKRLVTLLGPLGNRFRVVAGNEVRNFDQIRVGDELVVTHAEALTLELKKGGDGIRERAERVETARTPEGAKPGGAVAHTVTVVADVIAANPRTQVLTLRGAEHTVELRVPDAKQFRAVKVGDQVEAVFTEALVVAVQPAPKP